MQGRSQTIATNLHLSPHGIAPSTPYFRTEPVVPRIATSALRPTSPGVQPLINHPPKLRHRRRSRGQAVVEFAIIAPLLFLLLLIAVDFGRLFFTYIQVTNASREAAAYAVGQPTDTATMTTYAGRETDAQTQRGQGAFTVTATCADSGRDQPIACSSGSRWHRRGEHGHGQRERAVHLLHAVHQRVLRQQPPDQLIVDRGSARTRAEWRGDGTTDMLPSIGRCVHHQRFRPDRDCRRRRVPAKHGTVCDCELRMGHGGRSRSISAG